MPVTVLFLAIVPLIFGDYVTMSMSNSGVQLIGESVTVSYVADPSLGHGQFRLENHGNTAVMAAVKSAWLELGARIQPVVDVTLYDLAQEQMINPDGFKIEAGATKRFLIGFPKFIYEPNFGEKTNVGLRLTINGDELQAFSSIVFERRIPRT